jgi:hypothetical protein
MHEMADCTASKNITEDEQLDELSSATYKRAMNKAGNKAMWLSSAGKDNPAYKKRYAQAKKFQAKGIEQEKKEKAVKEDIELDEVVVARKMTPQEKAARGAYLKKHSEKLAGHNTGVTPKKSFKDINTERGDYGSQPSKMGIRPATEEVEQIDELSPATLGSYKTKAAGSEKAMTDKSSSLSVPAKDRNAAAIKANQRRQGMKLATKKLGEEVEQIIEKVKTTHENPLVTVHDKHGLHTHANLSTANKIFNTKVKHTDVHAGAVKTKDGHETKNNLTFAISKHHASAMKEEVIGEVLTKSTTAGETISDFVHSKNPKFAGKSKEKRKQMALAAYYTKQNEEKVQECGNAVEPLLGGNSPNGSDESAEMAKAELKAIANQAMALVMQIPDSMVIEPWVQSKIAQAKVMVSSVHDYMVYGDHDKQPENETMDTPMTFPNMSVDVNTGQNV